MRTLIKYILPLLFLALPLAAQASSTYTCSNTSLAPITVSDPAGADANTVSSYNSSCINSGGTVSGPSSQQLSAPSEAQQTASNQAYEQCMSIPGNSASACQQSAEQQTGAAPTNLNITAPPLPSYLPTIATSSPYTPPAASSATTPASSGGGPLTYTPLEPLPNGNAGTYNSLEQYLNLMFNILLSIGAMIAVVTLVLGGITFMISEVVDKRAAAKRRIQAAFIGLGLLLSCWLILNTINPNLTKFSLPGIDNATTGATNGGVASTVSANTNAQNAAQTQQQDCIKGGPMCALDPTPGGGFTCNCVGAF